MEATETQQDDVGLRVDMKYNPYNNFHRTLEVQVFPQNLRVTWDDTGCLVSMLFVLVTAVAGLIGSLCYLQRLFANEAEVNASDTLALFTETKMTIVALFCGGIILGFIFMCLCGVNTQLMAVRKRRFGSLRKNRILLMLMGGPTAWDDPVFQRRLRQRDRRLKRVQTLVEARLEDWLCKRDARVKHIERVRERMIKERMKKEMQLYENGDCVIL